MKRRLFLVPILCSLLLAGCGQGLKESPAEARQAAPAESSATQSATPASSGNEAAPAEPEAASSAAAGQDRSGAGQVAAKDSPVKAGIMPEQLEIPAIGVKAKVQSLGLTKDGAMDVPHNGDDVGWFKPGYRPGAPGHAVIAGHVDTKTSVAVFFKLKNLKKGNKVIVRGRDGEEIVFEVTGSETYPYDKAPLEKIFGPSDRPLLNLITCTGLYSKSKGTHQQRLVVTAELVS
ncbi:class F sortase [Cohnella pontilimi]|uniref:Class F sortase n=1 Tax=Cohnella pontilimi TaxID=2564100 RepID=A0A4U0F804_9BACL|nr:class F sortase [Cohnella pontilimi]TJY40846.1 class F sortase [Cohnella pontilimi]